MSSSFTITKNYLHYTIDYDPVAIQTSINCEHTKLGYLWKKVISDKLIKSVSDVVFQHSIGPEKLYKLLLDYKNGELNDFVTVSFQGTMKGEPDNKSEKDYREEYKDVPLQIEITIKSPLDKGECDCHSILLDADKSITPFDISKRRITNTELEILNLREEVIVLEGKLNSMNEKYNVLAKLVEGLDKRTIAM